MARSNISSCELTIKNMAKRGANQRLIIMLNSGERKVVILKSNGEPVVTNNGF